MADDSDVVAIDSKVPIKGSSADANTILLVLKDAAGYEDGVALVVR